MKRLLYPIYGCLFLVLLTSFEHKDAYKYDYIDTYCVLAVQEMYRSGIPASIILGQAVIESNFGTSDLAMKANNHFGIKCKSYWNGDTYYHEDDDYKNGRLIASCFRAYNSSIKSYLDHSNFLMKSERYNKLFSYGIKDYESWAYGLEKAGYATDPQYAEKLISAIEEYNLDRYDSVNLDEYK